MSTLRYENSSIFDADFDVLAHGVNCQGRMGRGIALEIKRRFPEVFRAYEDRIKERFRLSYLDDKSPEEVRLALLGYAQPVRYPKFVIYNLFTQYQFGTDKRYVSYDAIDQAFKMMFEDFAPDDYDYEYVAIKSENKPFDLNEMNFDVIRQKKIVKIAIPKIGSNLGGGDWNVISAIIESQLKKYPHIQVTVYDFKGDQPNVER